MMTAYDEFQQRAEMATELMNDRELVGSRWRITKIMDGFWSVENCVSRVLCSERDHAIAMLERKVRGE